ncbi:GMC oxidoreductase [Brucella intermedia]|uniref:GMC oxidoreductase n=1 Tax=Brucella intermedia TaxID=94625 RepID=UPI00124BF4CB|nr:GMC oxidoreductase [Brucella intermedia]KAB2721481.1 hypothetical protein F9L02_23215 [Brucella intermedia]
MIHHHGELLGSHKNFVCVVGSGPVGITAALELEKLGLFVVLLESGSTGLDHSIQELSDAVRIAPRRHKEMNYAVRRSFGGTSNLWGAGCIPLDPIDFERREIVTASPWPIAYGDLEAHLPAAAEYAGCGVGFVRDLSGIHTPAGWFNLNRVIRFASPPSFQTAYRKHLQSTRKIQLYLHSTVIDFKFRENGSVEKLMVRTADGESISLCPYAIVLACGGVETTRLLLSVQAKHPNCFGGPGGPLGRFYMGHLSGTISDITFSSAQVDRAFRFIRDADRHYYRRRILPDYKQIRENNLTNIGFWPVPPRLADPSHKSAVLSSAYLALSAPVIGSRLLTDSLRNFVTDDDTQMAQHLLNIATDLPALLAFLPGFVYARFLSKPSVPGIQFSNRVRKYALHYHAEHLPNSTSRITLDENCDRFGLRKVKLDLRFSEADALPIVKSHKLLGSWLSQNQIGDLQFSLPESDLTSGVLDQACDGVHQIGTIRMATNDKDGVVDSYGKVFHSHNLFVSGSAIFPTSGQANPTLTAMALAVRQARYIARAFR